MKIIIISIVALLSVVTSLVAHAEIYTNNTLVNVRLVKVDFYEAILDVEFYLADEQDHATFNIAAEGISQGAYLGSLRQGFNKFKFIIQRDKYKNAERIIDTITLTASGQAGYQDD